MNRFYPHFYISHDFQEFVNVNFSAGTDKINLSAGKSKVSSSAGTGLENQYP
jgi:hypothetical protein